MNTIEWSVCHKPCCLLYACFRPPCLAEPGMLQTWHKMSPATSADFSRVSSKSIIHEQVLGDDVAAFALAHVFSDECAALPQETSYLFPSPELTNTKCNFHSALLYLLLADICCLCRSLQFLTVNTLFKACVESDVKKE